MSWEAWGTPPDTEPELCPICDNTQHTPDKCEVAASEAHSRAHYEGVFKLWRAEHERQLTNAYAEGRKDEAEERGEGRPTVEWQDVQRVLGYLQADEAEIRAEKRHFTWADTMARASDLIRNLAPERRQCDCAKRLAGRVDGDVHLQGCPNFVASKEPK